MYCLKLITTICVCIFASAPMAQCQWVGRKFMPKYDYVVKIGDREVERFDLPFVVEKASGEWLWAGHG